LEPLLPVYIFPVAGTILGLIIGSFLATIMVRWPEGRSVIKGRSSCDSCGHQLRAHELVPIISYLWQRGKCGCCSAPIAKSHIGMELVACLIGGLALYISPDIGGLCGAIFGWFLLTLAALDAEHQWLPDQLTGSLAMTGLITALVVASPSIVERLIGGFAGFAVLFGIALAYQTITGRDGLGGGDPKMLSAIGCWLGWQALPLVMLGAAVTGLMVAVSFKMRRQKLNAETKLPFGSFMAVSAFPIWLLQSADISLFD